ncbi:hypothetical protein HL667_17895 [Bradyrhizobium sp. 83012]|uniref:Uncharacterized protein n=1 Tax=Bradyrhizobium aeschynomenes TaxID=2734909 RepID=A0ABX2CF91_9BRAD|nr:hypothetical protein [Bradyrhizobium aeschynomenes]NPU66881.1 hypothetical protein [Bradyrhizobium aeschynomenes]
MVNKSGDPIAFWQQMVSEMQKNFSALTRLRPMGVTSRPSPDDPATASGNGHKPMADLMENYFAGMNVPSRGQLTALNERLGCIEGELAETQTLLKQLLASTQVSQPMPQATADLASQLNEIKGLLDGLVVGSKLPPPAPVDIRPDLNQIKTLLDELVAASKRPQPEPKPAPDLTPQLSEIKALLEQILKASQTPDPAPATAIEVQLSEIREMLDSLGKSSQPVQAEPQTVQAATPAVEPHRHGKSRNKKHGGGAQGSPRQANDVPSGG